MSTKKREKPVLFPVLFPDQLKNWIKKEKEEGRNGSQYAFAKKVGVEPYYVTDWKTGRQGIPYTYIDKICEVLGVSKEVYYPTTHNELYKYSSDYMTEVGEKTIAPLCEKIGLNKELIILIQRMFPNDFEELFPFWTPIRPTRKMYSVEPYEHSDISCLSDSAKMKNGYNLFQFKVKANENQTKTITLSEADLLFLRDVQEDIKDYIEFLFLKRKKEMKTEGKVASERSWKPNAKGSGRVFVPLRANDLNEIDKYFKGYVDEKPTEDK